MTTIFLDIETIASADPALREEFAVTIKPPKTLKKAESIAAWERDEKEAAIDEKMAATVFDGTYGQIICAGIACDDEPVVSYTGEEKQILTDLFSHIYDRTTHNQRGFLVTEKATTFVGHNLAGFDMRYIWQRAIINGVQPPEAFPINAKPWDGRIYDTMIAWHPDRERRISLDKLCKALGVATPKTELDGSKVGEWYAAGRIAEIADYCRRDVEAVRTIYQRMTFK